MAAMPNKTQAVVGIDFGTAASGYCFAFSDKPDVLLDGDLPKNPRYHKAPTSLWNTPEGELRSFGLEALQGYAEDEFGDRDKSQFFSMYKLALVDAQADPIVKSENGVERPLLDIVSQTLEYIKSQALDRLQKTLGNTMEVDVTWVITLPAIWTDFAKHFMRRAALQAGLITTEASCRLLLALEPEAAVASCMNDLYPILKLPSKTKFCMVDCGGGTIDITSHIIASGGLPDDGTDGDGPLCLDELVPPTGGDWGSLRVDENFLKMVIEPLLGPSLFAKLRDLPAVQHQLMEEFEIKIKKPHSETNRSMRRLNLSVLDPVFEGEDISMKDLVDEFNAKQVDASLELEVVSKAILKVPAELIDSLFDPLLEKILETLETLFSVEVTQGMKYMFLVGGFSESQYLQERLKKTFEPLGVAIILPPSPGRSVMMGAVRFGLFPELFATRVSKFSYGVGATLDGTRNILDRFVTFGQAVRCGHTVERIYTPVSPAQKWVSVKICSTTNLEVSSVLDPSVSRLATLRAQVPQDVPFQERQVKVTLTFGATEISAVASTVGDRAVECHLVYNAPQEDAVQQAPFVGATSVQFLVDVSSSMASSTSAGKTKLDDAKDGVLYVADAVLDGAKGDKAGLSSFSSAYSPITAGTGPESMSSFVKDLMIQDNTRFYEAFLKQLADMKALDTSCERRFLLAFTDGEDNSSSNFNSDSSFQELHDLLSETGGICDQLTGIVVIAVGLTQMGLVPLKILSKTGKLKLISFEKETDIKAAFEMASEEISRFSEQANRGAIDICFPTSYDFE